MWLDSLLLLLRDRSSLVKLGRKLLADSLAKGLFDELAGVSAGLTGKARGRDCDVAVRADDNFDLHVAPPWMVNRIEPSANFCSVQR